jgi:predicted ATP-dependent protease
MIRPGALHHANGGYLILDASDLLTAPFAWAALKRCLTTGEIRITTPAEGLGFVSTVTQDWTPSPGLSLPVPEG